MLYAIQALTPSVTASERKMGTLILGMEALGDLMKVADGNEKHSLKPGTGAQLGDLLCYIATEVLRLKEGV